MTGDRSGKHVLEYGCGEGWITRDLAHQGALVSAFDISAEAVRKTHQILVSAGLSEQCRVARMGAERLDYPDRSFVIAIDFAILHHLELETAVTEFCRVRKPDGVAFVASLRNKIPDQSLPPPDAAVPHRG